MDKRSDPISQDVSDIADTRAAMAEKLEQLEERVQETMRETKMSVLDIVDHVRDTAESFIDRTEKVVEQTKQGLDPRYQTNRHPWLMMGAAVLAGFVIGTIEHRQTSGRPVGSSRYAYQGPPYGRGSRHVPRTNIWDGVVGKLQEEIEYAKRALMKEGRTFIHDFFQQVLPALLTPLHPRRPQRSTSSSRPCDEAQDDGSHSSRLRG
jgi:ElaB/YqjD/DUF883 family membrane-anchored ribosome-binding protein